MHNIRNRKGVIIIFVLLILIALMGVALAFWYAVNSEIRSAGVLLADTQAFYIAEAGRAKARYELTTDGQTVPYTETDTAFGNGTYTVTAVYSDPPTNQLVTITSDGYVPDSTNIRAQRQVVEKNISFAGPGVGGGTNLSLAATADASDKPNQAKLANDDKLQTSWKSNATGSFWMTMAFAAVTDINKVVINGSNTGSYAVQYSNNGTTWTNVASPVENPAGTITFNTVSARYMRLNFSGVKPQINELQTYGGPSLGQGKFATSL